MKPSLKSTTAMAARIVPMNVRVASVKLVTSPRNFRTLISKLVQNFKNYQREVADAESLLSDANKPFRNVVFYGESGIYYRYYQDYIDHILANTDLQIGYMTSDPNDPIFKLNEPRLKPFYIRTLLSAVMAKIDANALVLATPDLGKFAIKRASSKVHHIYAFRGVASTHLGYRQGAFDEYDSILCVGEYQVNELRKMEEMYKTPAKRLVVTGYPLIERIYKDHQEFLQNTSSSSGSKPICLIAPTWSPFDRNTSILESCILDLIKALDGQDMNVWIRPHPEFMRRSLKQVENIQKLIARRPNFSVQMELSSFEVLHRADMLITDHSAISMDYALGTERPVLFIDTALREDNPQWKDLGLQPVERKFRDLLGRRLKPEEVNQAASVLTELNDSKDSFKEKLPAMRDELIANWMHSAQVGADHIISIAKSTK
jgi:YidC/Oxa1 family membrane protein insertase